MTCKSQLDFPDDSWYKNDLYINSSFRTNTNHLHHPWGAGSRLKYCIKAAGFINFTWPKDCRRNQHRGMAPGRHGSTSVVFVGCWMPGTIIDLHIVLDCTVNIQNNKHIILISFGVYIKLTLNDIDSVSSIFHFSCSHDVLCHCWWKKSCRSSQVQYMIPDIRICGQINEHIT